MNNITGYSAYQNTLHTLSSSQKNTSTKETTTKAPSSKNTGVRNTTTEKAKEKASSPVLSDKAKALLQELKKTYSNMDFFVADYDSDEEAQSYLARGSKEYSVLIDPQELEKMAGDDEVKSQNLSLLDDAVKNLDSMKEQLKDTENEDSVVHLGVTIGSDGNVSYFAELEKIGERQKEFVDKIREEKQDAKEKAEKDASKDVDNPSTKNTYGKVRRTTLHSCSVDDLLKQINQLDWSTIPEEILLPGATGNHFDLSV